MFGVVSLGVAAVAGKARLPRRWFVLVGLCVLLPFFARNVMLSGYPYFPLSWLPFPVDWKVPAFIQDGNLACMMGYAKAGDCQFRAPWDFGWLGFWWHSGIRGRSGFFNVPLALLLFGCVLGGKKLLRAPVAHVLWPAAVASAGIFLIAPDCRFFGGSVWIIGLVAAAAAFAGEGPFLKFLPVKGLVIVLVGVFGLMSAWGAWTAVAVKRHVPVDGGVYKAFRLDDAFDVVQLQGDDRCWATSVPCTPHRIGGLKLRDPRRVGAGFTRRGDSGELTP